VSSFHWLQLLAGPLAAALEACLLVAGVPWAVSGWRSPAVLGCPRPDVFCLLPSVLPALVAGQAGSLAVAGQAGSLGSVWCGLGAGWQVLPVGGWGGALVAAPARAVLHSPCFIALYQALFVGLRLVRLFLAGI
jgi:hypothetical protein